MRRCPCSHLLSHACGTPNRVLETLTESKIQYRSPLATDRPPEASEAKRAGIAAVATRWLFEHGQAKERDQREFVALHNSPGDEILSALFHAVRPGMEVRSFGEQPKPKCKKLRHVDTVCRSVLMSGSVRVVSCWRVRWVECFVATEEKDAARF